MQAARQTLRSIVPSFTTYTSRAKTSSAVHAVNKLSTSSDHLKSSSTTTSAPSTSPSMGSGRSSSRIRRPPPMEVTPEAAARIHHLLSQKAPRPTGVRVSLRTRGCNGMSYTLNYADEAAKFDERVEIGNGAAVFVDPRALMHVVGTTMDFVDNDLVSEFVFNNPNAKGTCGCGESFNV